MFKKRVQLVAVLCVGCLLFDPIIPEACFASFNHPISVVPITEELATQTFALRPAWVFHLPEPIEMVVNNYRNGARVVLLGDPHPEIFEMIAYADFLKFLMSQLIKEAGLTCVYLEVSPGFMEQGLIPYIQEWVNSNIQDLDEFQQKHGVTRSKTWYATERNYLPMLRVAHENGLSLRGFDVRTGSQVAGAQIDEAFYSKIMESFDASLPASRALIIAGTFHVGMHPNFPTLGSLFARQKDFQIKTIHVEVGVAAEDDARRDLRMVLRDSKIPTLSIENLMSSSLANVRVGNFPSIADIYGPLKLDLESYARAFHQLIYFRSNRDLENYLRSFISKAV